MLDVGCGHGALSAEVLAAFPRARVVCHDFSDPMLEVEKAKLRDHGPSARVVDLMEEASPR